jgi:hypothetical protein
MTREPTDDERRLLDAFRRISDPRVRQALLVLACQATDVPGDALRPEYQLDYARAKPNRYVDAIATTGGKVTIERLNAMSVGELRRLVAAHGIARVRAALDEIEHG